VAEQATERMVVSATPAHCFEVSSDIAAYPEWAADIKEVSIEDRDDEGRPTLVTFRAAAFGRSTSYTLAYDYSEAPEVLSWVQTKGDITAKLDGRYVFAADGSGGTEVTYHLEVELKVPLPGFIKMRAQSRIMSIALRELKARVESSS
jgi:ribosome-associated toxin RatA of RatAB toxin-antitoxin module